MSQKLRHVSKKCGPATVKASVFSIQRRERYIEIVLDCQKFRFPIVEGESIKSYKLFEGLIEKRMAWGPVYPAKRSKLEEEFRELYAALCMYDVDPSPKHMRNVIEELGDVFNVIVGLGTSYTDIGYCAVDLVNSMTGVRISPIMNAMLLASEYKSLISNVGILLHKAADDKSTIHKDIFG